jgi:hypothetical protein
VDLKGNIKLIVRKSHNPKTGHRSGVRHDFSAIGWNKTTLDYLDSVKNLPSARLIAIFDEAKGLATKGVQQSTVQKSGRAALQSDDELEGSESIGLLATMIDSSESRCRQLKSIIGDVTTDQLLTPPRCVPFFSFK